MGKNAILPLMTIIFVLCSIDCNKSKNTNYKDYLIDEETENIDGDVKIDEAEEEQFEISEQMTDINEKETVEFEPSYGFLQFRVKHSPETKRLCHRWKLLPDH